MAPFSAGSLSGLDSSWTDFVPVVCRGVCRCPQVSGLWSVVCCLLSVVCVRDIPR